MASENGRSHSPVITLLLDEAHRFEFLQAVRLLERNDRSSLPVGRDHRPSAEVARFRTRVSLEFPPSEIFRIQRGAGPPEIEVAFLGMTGPLGVMPHPYTELLLERTRKRDNALWEFLDIFNHRLISLFYRSWEKYHFAIGYERDRSDPFTRCLFSLVGVGTRGLQERMSVPDRTLIFYGGLAAQRPHSGSAISNVLSDYFGVRAKVEQFFGQWLKLDRESITRLGCANNELGVTSIAGTRVWDVQSKFRIKLGPVSFNQFVDFLPTGSAFKQMCDLVRFMAGAEYDFDAQLVLKREEVPASVLTTHARRKPMLGWTSWLKTKPFEEDDTQVVLNPDLIRQETSTRVEPHVITEAVPTAMRVAV